MMISEALLEGLGVETAGGNDREIKAYCPVHHLKKGRGSSSPKWYMNRATGAWICFSCQQRGSLQHLVELLGGDAEILEEVEYDVMRQKLHKNEDDDVKVAEPEVYISDYAFSKQPLPPLKVCEARDITPSVCAEYNVRWDKTGKHFLIPLYTTDGGKFVGWQEKSKRYFNNVPPSVPKAKCLFGYQQFHRGEMIMVESPLDVLRLAQHGITGAVATLGSYVSKEQIDAALSAATKFVLAFDDDEAGDTANQTIAEEFDRRNIDYRRFRYPRRNRIGNSKAKFKDIGELPIEDVRYGLSRASSITSTKTLR